MARALSVVVATAAIASLTACSSVTAPSTDLITARAEAQALDLKNNSNDRVYFFVADRGVLAVLDLAICNEPSACESVAPGGTKRVPYAGVAGYSRESREAVVFHWRLVPRGAGKFEHDVIRTLVVRLR